MECSVFSKHQSIVLGIYMVRSTVSVDLRPRAPRLNKSRKRVCLALTRASDPPLQGPDRTKQPHTFSFSQLRKTD